MARVCTITGKRPFVGGSISRSGKAKKDGGIGRHVTKVNKRIFAPNLQRVKIIDENGTVKYVARRCQRHQEGPRYQSAQAKLEAGPSLVFNWKF